MDNSNAPVGPPERIKAFFRSINLRDPKVIGFGLLILAAIVGVVASGEKKPEKKPEPEKKPDEPRAPVNVHVHNHGPRVKAVKDSPKPDKVEEKKDSEESTEENDGDEIVAK